MGDVAAARELEEMENNVCPVEVRYLVDWAFELHGRSGHGGFGANPLNPVVIEAWARLNQIELHWWEVRALLELDAKIASRSRPPREDGGGDPEEPKRTREVRIPWPTRRAEPQFQSESEDP